MKYSYIIGNWKLHGNKKMIHKFFTKFIHNIHIPLNYRIIITPPFVYLDLVKKYLSNIPIYLGAQNVDIHSSGAFTGEISADMLKDVGVQYVIIGHSERRIYHKETEKHIAKKFFITKNTGLTPILCIGENQKEYINHRTQQVCIAQIQNIIDTLGIISLENSIIAYEPIWAIGTGKTPTDIQVNTIHKNIRSYLDEKNKKISETISIQYGGSVNSKNAKNFLNQPNIDGILIGNASLHISTFLNIISNKN
ncbi:MAG: triose-phosphate isomerase [Candidatus Westeberhardia cardiocondylae]|nr:triose-phosphate isomerase [Candidatus Westeberhardia cardiocondylae]